MSEAIEIAKTGRSRCQVCGAVLPAKAPRFGVTKAAFGFDGTTTAWFHLACGAADKPTGFRRALEKWTHPLSERDQLEAIVAIAQARKPTSASVSSVLWKGRNGTSFLVALSNDSFALLARIKNKNTLVEGPLDDVLACVPESDFADAVQAAKAAAKRLEPAGGIDER